MTNEPGLIVQLPRDGEVDRQFRADPPPSVASGQIVLDHVAREADGRLPPPEAGEIVMSVPSPETLAREPDEVRDVIRNPPEQHPPLLIILEAPHVFRDDH